MGGAMIVKGIIHPFNLYYIVCSLIGQSGRAHLSVLGSNPNKQYYPLIAQSGQSCRLLTGQS